MLWVMLTEVAAGLFAFDSNLLPLPRRKLSSLAEGHLQTDSLSDKLEEPAAFQRERVEDLFPREIIGKPLVPVAGCPTSRKGWEGPLEVAALAFFGLSVAPLGVSGPFPLPLGEFVKVPLDFPSVSLDPS